MLELAVLVAAEGKLLLEQPAQVARVQLQQDLLVVLLHPVRCQDLSVDVVEVQELHLEVPHEVLRLVLVQLRQELFVELPVLREQIHDSLIHHVVRLYRNGQHELRVKGVLEFHEVHRQPKRYIRLRLVLTPVQVPATKEQRVQNQRKCQYAVDARLLELHILDPRCQSSSLHYLRSLVLIDIVEGSIIDFFPMQVLIEYFL